MDNLPNSKAPCNYAKCCRERTAGEHLNELIADIEKHLGELKALRDSLPVVMPERASRALVNILRKALE